MKKVYFSTNSLTKHKYFLVDDKDYQRVNKFKWRVDDSKNCKSKKHLKRHLIIVRCATSKEKAAGAPKTIKLHRFIFKLKKEDKRVVDHVNRTKWYDATRKNLRLATIQENNRNLKRINKTGYRGVTKSKNGYVANICHNGNINYIGYFKCPKEAHRAYKKAAKKLHGKFAFGG